MKVEVTQCDNHHHGHRQATKRFPLSPTEYFHENSFVTKMALLAETSFRFVIPL